MPPQHPLIRISLSHTSRYDTTQPQYPRSKHASSLCTRLVTSLTFRRTHSINELLVLMLTLKNYERSANSRLRPLREHIFFSRDPMLPRLNLATLHQLLAPAPKDNLNALISSLNQALTFNPIATHYISLTSKLPTRLYIIIPDLLETYFSHTFNV